MDIVKGNALISKFMKDNPGLEYHKSWDLLMLVIEKIGQIKMPDDKYENGNRIYVEQIYPRTFGMKDENGKYMFRFNGFSLHKEDKLIEAAYVAVIEVMKFNIANYFDCIKYH